MGCQLGIDLGVTETTVAAIEGDWPAVVSLGGASSLPTVLYLAPDGATRGGRAGARLARTDPRRAASGFVERLGEPAPMLVGGVGFSASALVARYLNWLIAAVTRQRGAAPDLIVITVPDTWPAVGRRVWRTP